MASVWDTSYAAAEQQTSFKHQGLRMAEQKDMGEDRRSSYPAPTGRHEWRLQGYTCIDYERGST
jgi:hypothetical protein